MFTEASYGFGSSKWESEESQGGYSQDSDGETKLSAWSIGAGYSFFVSDMISINPSIALGGLKTVVEDAASSNSGYPYYYSTNEDEETTYSGISFNIGISLFLE